MLRIKNISQLTFFKKIFIVFISTILLAISSKIKIPFYPVPMTMQTFVVIMIGITLGWKLGVASITLYLLEGALGLPVFSGTPEKGIGIVYFTGPTMGYLIGFIIAAYLAGNFNYNNNFILNFFKIVFATSFIYLLGVIWLGVLIGWDKPLFNLGVKPFLLAEICKMMLATSLIVIIKKK